MRALVQLGSVAVKVLLYLLLLQDKPNLLYFSYYDKGCILQQVS